MKDTSQFGKLFLKSVRCSPLVPLSHKVEVTADVEGTQAIRSNVRHGTVTFDFDGEVAKPESVYLQSMENCFSQL